jgi:chitin disaccharide deacetylase
MVLLVLGPAAFFLLATAAIALLWWRANAVPLAVRLGYGPQDKLLIVNADDAGLCHSANAAVFQGLEEGMITSCSVMVPAPGFAEVAEYARAHPQADIGIHLTHTAEWQSYRWGPVLPAAQVPTLVDADGFFRREVFGERGVYAHSTPAVVYREAVAQAEKAKAAGLDPSHIDSHMGTMQYDLRYAWRYIRLALKLDVPLRMPSQDLCEKYGARWLRPALRTLGLVFPDYLIYEEGKRGPTAAEHWHAVLRDLKPGVTEIFIHPALGTAEMQGITASWLWRRDEFLTFLADPETRRILQEQGITLIGYRPLRDLQRGTYRKPGRRD